MNKIGQRIKKIRKLKGYSQKSLSFGICSQSELSKIENNQLLPGIDLCNKIANKLDITINELFNDNLYFDENITIKKIIELYYKKKFEECLEIIIKLDKKRFCKYEQILMYLKGGCYYHLKRELGQTIELLEHGLFMTYTEFKVNIMPIEIHFINLLGILYSKKNNYKADTYLSKCLIFMERDLYPDIHYINFSKCYYNIAKYHFKMNKFKESESIVLKGIEWCVKKQTLYYLVELYNLLTEIYNKNKKEKLFNKTRKLHKMLISIHSDHNVEIYN